MKTKKIFTIVIISIMMILGIADLHGQTKDQKYVDSVLITASELAKEDNLSMISKLENDSLFALSNRKALFLLRRLNAVIDFQLELLDLYRKEQSKNAVLQQENEELKAKLNETKKTKK